MCGNALNQHEILHPNHQQKQGVWKGKSTKLSLSEFASYVLFIKIDHCFLNGWHRSNCIVHDSNFLKIFETEKNGLPVNENLTEPWAVWVKLFCSSYNFSILCNSKNIYKLSMKVYVQSLKGQYIRSLKEPLDQNFQEVLEKFSIDWNIFHIIARCWSNFSNDSNFSRYLKLK